MCRNRSSLSSSVGLCCLPGCCLPGCCPRATIRKVGPAQVRGCRKARTQRKAGLYETNRRATPILENSDGLSSWCQLEEGADEDLLWAETWE